jgi:hypothetical protein
MIRDGLRNGTSHAVLLRRAHELSPNPDAWTYESIARIAREMHLTAAHPRGPVANQDDPPIPTQTQQIEANIAYQRNITYQSSGRSVSGLIRYLLQANESHDNILARARALARSRGGNPDAWTALSIERIAREMRLTATQHAVETRETSATTLPEGIDAEATFGIEIEFLIPNTHNRGDVVRRLQNAGILVQDEDYNHHTRSWWKLTHDSSVQCGIDGKDRDYFGGNELVSPILRGSTGLEQIKKVCQVLASMKCKVNKTCGLHVHHGVTGPLWERIQITRFFRNAFLIYLNYQNKLKAMVPKSRRNNTYCYTIRTSILNYFSSGPSEMSHLQHSESRYMALNPQSFWRQGTLEFRLHSGTLDAEKISNWVIITQKMILKAKTFTQDNVDVETYRFNKIHKEFNWADALVTYYKKRVEKFNSVNELEEVM